MVLKKEKPVKNSVQLLFGSVLDANIEELCGWIISENLAPVKANLLTLLINSEGGDLHAAFALIECMNASTIPVRTVGVGQTLSAGLIIAMSGTKGMRIVTPTCSIMSHSYSTQIEGNHYSLLEVQRELCYTHNRIVEQYIKCTGKSKELINEKLTSKNDSWLLPPAAVEFGLFDRVDNLKF